MTSLLTWAFVSALIFQEKPTDLESMQGEWKIVKAGRLGKPWPKDELEKLSFKVKGNNFIIISGRPEPALVELDPTKSPKQFRMKIRGGRADELMFGIYELKNDQLKVCWARPGKQRPDKFNGSENQFLLIMNRIKD